MKALDTFRHPVHRHNCAQAIANKWKALYKHDNIVEAYTPYVAGRAPEGYCGALYAAMQARPAHAEAIKQRFAAIVGDTHCRDIKAKSHTPCEVCVDTADRLLEEYSK